MAYLIAKSINVSELNGEKWADCSKCRRFLPVKSSYSGFCFCKDCVIENATRGLFNNYR